jgi:ankyrin repeat protein
VTTDIIEILIDGNVAGLERYLAAGGDVNAVHEGNPLLTWACSLALDHPHMVKLLVEHGADVNRRGHNGEIPLATASYLGAASTVALLLGAGARVNDADDDIGQTALMVAAKGGHLDIMERLVAHGGKVNAKDKRGGTALHWSATEADRPDVARYLLGLGLDPDGKNITGHSAKDYARALNFKDMLKVMEQA